MTKGNFRTVSMYFVWFQVLLGGGLFINVSAEPDEIMENSILRKRAPLAELEDAENSPFKVTLNSNYILQ